METTGFVHRLISWSGTTLFVASTLALVSLCWSGVDYRVLAESDLGIGSSDDENVSGSTVDTEPLFQSLQKIAHGERWPSFLRRDAMLARNVLSLRVRLSVTSRYCIESTGRIECYKEIFVSPIITALPPRTLSLTLDLENFAMASQSRCQ